LPPQIASNTDEGWLLKWSGEYEVIGDYWLPTWVEMTLAGFDGPDMLARVELRNHKPQLVRLEWSSSLYQRGIRQSDLRTMEIGGFLDVLYAGLAHQGDPRAARNRGDKDINQPGAPEYIAAHRLMQDLRRPSGSNAITPEFLKAVAARSRRTVPLNPAVVALLRRHNTTQKQDKLGVGDQWVDGGLVFTNEFGGPVDPRNLLRVIENAAKAAEAEGIGVHTLRHSAAVAWLDAGVHIKAVVDLLGHSSIAIAGDVYGHQKTAVTDIAHQERLTNYHLRFPVFT
jgi:Phage integrase family